jgi:hypothetical protein
MDEPIARLLAELSPEQLAELITQARLRAGATKSAQIGTKLRIQITEGFSRNLTINIVMALSSTPGTNRIEIVLARQSLTVNSLSAMPALNTLSPTNAINVIGYAARINDAIRTAVNAALGPLMPVRINIPFGVRQICDIGIRQLATRLLPAGNGTQPALGFFATLRDGSAGNINQASVSTLPTTAEGSFALANNFLLHLVCCLIQGHTSIKGLGNPTSHDVKCCRWEGVDNVSIGNQTVRLEGMGICIERSVALLASPFLSTHRGVVGGGLRTARSCSS